MERTRNNTYTVLGAMLALMLLLLLPQSNFAQDGSAKPTEKEKEPYRGMKFNGLGRVNLLQTGIDGDILEGDTATPRSLTDGEFLLDLKMNATPNDNTEIQGILRLRNEFGGFFGAGQSIEVRELWARGIIADVVEYRVGDMDIEMSPYTFYNAMEEGTVNEPSIFQPQKELIYYEQFYGDFDSNTRRMQGAKLDFGLKFTDVIYDADFSGFIARVRGTDFFTIPTRWVSGGNVRVRTKMLVEETGTRATLGFNIIHTFDDLQSGEANTGIRNTVTTFSFDVTAYENDFGRARLFGETGSSKLTNKNDSVTFFTTDDVFLDIRAGYDFKKNNVSVFAGFSDVGPDFFSIGAQSKRVDFEAAKTYYDRAGADQAQRQVNLFDISRDRAVYTYQLSDKLMAYDPRFSNTFPYGPATPNRRGVNYGADYENEFISAELNGALMSEIRGQGTEELKDFNLIRVSGDLNVHELIDWENNVVVTVGYQYENTTRGGVEVEQVDLSSNLFEAGLELELFDNFELLAGAKLLQAEGSDYVPRVDEFNIVRDFPGRTEVDDTETLLAGGIKYTFKKGVYLTLQYQRFDATGREDVFRDYTLDQIFVLYTMNF